MNLSFTRMFLYLAQALGLNSRWQVPWETPFVSRRWPDLSFEAIAETLVELDLIIVIYSRGRCISGTGACKEFVLLRTGKDDFVAFTLNRTNAVN